MEFNEMPPPTTWRKKWKNIVIELAIFAIVLISLIIFVPPFLKQQKTVPRQSSLSITPTLTPTPIPFSYQGKMEFTITTNGTFSGPNFTECAIDPLDPHGVKDQLFTIMIRSKNPVVSAIAKWITDHGQHSVPLSLISGTATEGVWSGTWTVDDTAWYKYQIAVSASDGVETRETAITLR